MLRFLLVMLIFLLPLPGKAQKTDSVYLFSYFMDNGQVAFI